MTFYFKLANDLCSSYNIIVFKTMLNEERRAVATGEFPHSYEGTLEFMIATIALYYLHKNDLY